MRVAAPLSVLAVAAMLIVAVAAACGNSGGGTCDVNGGGRGPAPDNLGCSVLVYCGTTQYKLVCDQNASTCSCEKGGTTQQTIPNDPKYCTVPPDGGVGPQMQLANQACGWNANLGSWASR